MADSMDAGLESGSMLLRRRAGLFLRAALAEGGVGLKSSRDRLSLEAIWVMLRVSPGAIGVASCILLLF